MSVHRLSAGNGFAYLLRDTASGDVHRGRELPLTEYYAGSGNPPGQWSGSGLAGLADGAGIPRGAVVTEAAMSAVFGHATDPVTGTALGRGFPHRVGLDGVRRPAGVAGFDLTFTVPKSISVLWALGDDRTRAAVTAAHHAAIDQVVDLIEQRVLATRVGHGGVIAVATRGVMAAGFDHPDTRTGDPNLHTHLVVANRVQGPDGAWRAIDGQPLFAAAVTLSETYDALVTDEVARRLPVTFGWRDRGPRRTPGFELDGVDDRLLALFSTRSAAIATHLEHLVTGFTITHGRGPNRVETTRLRQTATLATRPAKTAHAWSELFTSWRQRAAALTGREPRDLLAAALDGEFTRPLRSSDIGPGSHRELAALAIVGVQERRSTWNAWNLEAEIARLTKSLTMASPEDRARLHAAVLQAAVGQCVPLHPDELVVDRWAGMRLRWTSTAILDAETHLVTVAQTGVGPRVNPRLAQIVSDTLTAAGPGGLTSVGTRPLAPDQAAAMLKVCTSGRALEVLVGPAGSGKTATLTAIRAAWNSCDWTSGVAGLAPSATAAHELSQALGVPCETTAKWLHETTGPAGQARLNAIRGIDTALSVMPADSEGRYDQLQQRHALTQQQSRWQLERGQLLIVDEATLAGTLDLHHLVTQAQAAGAKVLLVGDQHQLTSIQAGGAFGLLARRTQTAQLTGLWRFRHRWEAHATRLLRIGDPAALHAYATHDRLHSGTQQAMLDAAYRAWRHDSDHGRDAILIATDQASVNELNTRARTDAILTGRASPHGVPLAEGTTAGVGDTVITRHNDRSLRVGVDDHVRNGTTWTITATHPDGALTVQLKHRADTQETLITDEPRRPAIVVLPAAYVAEHVDLGYAITAQRVQSRTVDAAHVITGEGMSREHLYVALTRGRDANHAYTPLDFGAGIDSEPHQWLRTGTPPPTGRQLLSRILATSSAEPSATESLEVASHPQPDPAFTPRPQHTFLGIDAHRSPAPDGPGLSR